MPTTAAHNAAAVASTPRRPANGFCHLLEIRCGLRRRQCLRHHCRFAVQSLQNAFRRKRQFAKAHAGRIIDRVGDGGSARDRGGLADAERRLILPRQHQHVDLGHVGEFDDGVGAPFARRHLCAVERHFLHQRAAGRLDHVAVDLMTHPFRVDHQPGILARDHAGDADIAGRLVDRDVGDPCRPRRAIAREFAVHIERIGKAAAAHDVALGFRLLPHRPWFPPRALGHRIDEIDGARVLQIAQAIFDRIDAGLSGEFVDVGFHARKYWAAPRRRETRRRARSAACRAPPRACDRNRKAGSRCDRPSRTRRAPARSAR